MKKYSSSYKEKQERVVEGRGLIDLVFSWSFNDVLDKDFYKNQEKQIPNEFSSTSQYLRSFVTPLLEETHTDLKSSVEMISHSSPCCQVRSVKKAKEDYKPPKDLFYTLEVARPDKTKTKRDNNNNKKIFKDNYEPQNGDLVALTSSVRPKCRDDLAGNYVVAKVLRVGDGKLVSLSVLSSKPIVFVYETVDGERRLQPPLYAVYLINMTTNIRIWEALFSDPHNGNTSIIEKTLEAKFFDDQETCAKCNSSSTSHAVENYSGEASLVERAKVLQSSDLNESQKSAVLTCMEARECRHRSTVKLIWGPPGTGKTKTVGFMLHSLLGMKCRTLTCAPTNVAVLQVTERLLRRVADSAKCDKYGLGDIVLLGNKKRMNIEEREDLHDVFLDYRVKALKDCFDSKTGWTSSLLTMIGLLEDPEELYPVYLEELKTKGDSEDEGSDNLNDDEEKGSGKISEENNKKTGNKSLNQAIIETLRDNKKLKDKKKSKHGGEKVDDQESKSTTHNNVIIKPLAFEEFVKKRFVVVAEQLYFCAVNLYTHLPTSLISLKTVNRMLEAVESLMSFQTLLPGITDEELKQAFGQANKSILSNKGSQDVFLAKEKAALLLKSLPLEFPLPIYSNALYMVDGEMLIRQFCLNEACLIFCTVSSSATIKGLEIPLELLIVDEAAQLKECESTIPLQLPGIRHAILIGDEKQLPAMVQSKVCEEANFGRSLFERLASLGHKKHLLNVQHRMHPSISLFPNGEFYENKILDGQNVNLRSYCKSFLEGKMFGSYSFINVAHGRESVGTGRSSKNMVEVSVVADIVERLYKEVKSSQRKVSVGVISPYKAQVYAISDAIGKKYTLEDNNDFSLTVRSVDGFQGGEEDVIIISTVRSNGTGNVGFLSNRQRANVALTRARHCLWIVGSGVTLSGSSSVWKRLVTDAKQRGCFHNADDDQNLAQTIAISLIDQLKHTNVSPNNLVSFLFIKGSWKVLFDDAFWRSMSRIENNEVRKEVLCLIEKLSQGWRESKNESNHNEMPSSSSSSRFVEHYKVNKTMWLVWAVEILRENSSDVQVLKVWDVLASFDLPRLSNHLDREYGSYTSETLSRCEYRSEERNLLVPMKWPAQPGFVEADPIDLMSKSLGSLSLKSGLLGNFFRK